MTPREIVFRLIELGCVFQAQPKNLPQNGMNNIFGMILNQQAPQQGEDFHQLGYNKEDEESDDDEVEIVAKEPDFTLETITDPKELIKHEAWFLGTKPPATFPARLAGQIMSIGIFERHLLIRCEELPWGLSAGEIKFACEYITGLDLRNGTLLITSKVGNVALQIHEIDPSQCIA
jgi:hypothetical protein